MRDADTLAKVIHQIELILADHIEPGHFCDPEATIHRIFAVMETYDAVKAADRIEAGYGLRVVK
jgi:hypothetical protein